MSIPISGLVVLAITAVLWALRPDDLIALALALSSLEAASVVNIKSGFPVGIAPYYFLAILIAIRLLPRWISGKVSFFRDEPAAAYTRVTAIFVAWCVISAFVLPRLFAGLPVDVPRAGVSSHHDIPVAPLQWSFSNGGQAVYMILNFVIVLEFLRKSNDVGFPGTLSRTFAIAGVIAAMVGLFQIACGHLGLTYPAWLFNSNQVWGQSFEQKMAGGFVRMSATFVEPSVAGLFFAAWMVFELTMAISPGTRELWHWILATLATVALFLTTATTGYVVAGVMWSIAFVQTTVSVLGTGVLRVRKALAILAAVGGAILVLLLVPGVWGLLNAVLFNKESSDSAIDRSATLGRAVMVLLDSWGLGVGLGSNRAMSTFFYVLSNLGLLGTLLFVYIVVKPYFMARTVTRSPQIPRELRAFIRAAQAAFAATLVGMLTSGAEITSPQLWLLLGMLLAGTRQAWLVEVAARQNRSSKDLVSHVISWRLQTSSAESVTSLGAIS